MLPSNLLSHIPADLSAEVFETLVEAGALRIERIISRGHASSEDVWLDQPQTEWVALLHGAARLRFEDRVVEMKPGDWVHIAAREKHSVEWTPPDETTIWLAVHYG